MTKSFAWIAINEAIDKDGFYLPDGPEVYEAERAALKEQGAPDTELIEFISVLPEDRDEAMVEALVTYAFADWAKSQYGTTHTEPVDNGDSNLVYYDETAEVMED
jgi:hypothetical protein